jgi:beta-lactamase class A
MSMPHSRRAFLTGASAGVLGIAGFGPYPAAASVSDPWQSKEKPDSKLQKLLEDRVRPFRGEVGVYVRHLPSGRTASVRADELFPTASLIKVSIMLALFDRIERGELSYHQEFTYDGTYTYQGKNDDILSRFKVGESIRLSKLIMLMITISDNTASKWCQELAGGGTRINEALEAHGFRSLRINARTPGRESDYEAYDFSTKPSNGSVTSSAAPIASRIRFSASCDSFSSFIARPPWCGARGPTACR